MCAQPVRHSRLSRRGAILSSISTMDPSLRRRVVKQVRTAPPARMRCRSAVAFWKRLRCRYKYKSDREVFAGALMQHARNVCATGQAFPLVSQGGNSQLDFNDGSVLEIELRI